jgi:mono/diheme cytochrome c family protein
MMPKRYVVLLFVIVLLVIAVLRTPVHAVDAKFVPSAKRGYQTLTSKAFLPADFDQQVFDELWKSWPKEQREQAEKASPVERRRMAFSRYGLIESPDHPGTGAAWGYLPNEQGGWVMNCLSCHGGKVAGKAVLGLPNSHYGLETLTEDVRNTKLRLGKKLGHMDMAQLGMPLGSSHGTTNSVMFGVALEALRDADMKVYRNRLPPPMDHHDLDAPPWWNVKRKSRLYYDGMVKKGHRPIIQFVLLPRNDEKVLASWENDFRDILAWIESLEAPKYPWEIDTKLADSGREVFNRQCASCHGTYGKDGRYPEKMVDLDRLGTDPVRLNSLSPAYRTEFQHSWLADYNRTEPIWLPKGYVAPPLDGIWASAPYLHNGSVPTLWHILHPDLRPNVWKRTEDGYDREKIGLEVSTFEALPATAKGAGRRYYFDTSLFGKSAAGHRFPDELSEDEKRAVLEYLKTL